MDESDNIHRLIIALLVCICTLQIMDRAYDLYADNHPLCIAHDLFETEETEEYDAPSTTSRLLTRTLSRIVPPGDAETTSIHSEGHNQYAEMLPARHPFQTHRRHVFCVYRL